MTGNVIQAVLDRGRLFARAAAEGRRRQDRATVLQQSSCSDEEGWEKFQALPRQ